MTSLALTFSTLSLLAACVSTQADVPRGHPANPDSPTTPLGLAPTLPRLAATPDAAPPEAQAHEHEHDGAAEVWTCPMHPEVVKHGPGQCPICGMNLVKRPAGKEAH